MHDNDACLSRLILFPMRLTFSFITVHFLFRFIKCVCVCLLFSGRAQLLFLFCVKIRIAHTCWALRITLCFAPAFFLSASKIMQAAVLVSLLVKRKLSACREKHKICSNLAKTEHLLILRATLCIIFGRTRNYNFRLKYLLTRFAS